ncbi:hypothetical protein EVAR_679_1 [Eumeta japonica]|uniref:Secreted protein n=1 Tax=Eumeta variegata TaxID=151549 RepID=A0A4C1SEG3_EUMVA|nr:hypothetical protein EVAR_679_1 [Eumeta japonica]
MQSRRGHSTALKIRSASFVVFACTISFAANKQPALQTTSIRVCLVPPCARIENIMYPLELVAPAVGNVHVTLAVNTKAQLPRLERVRRAPLAPYLRAARLALCYA